MNKITLNDWNKSVYGGRYKPNTLRKWARTGLIRPAPEKVGKDWMVDQCARYVKPEKQQMIPQNIDMTVKPVDPVVLSILGKAA